MEPSLDKPLQRFLSNPDDGPAFDAVEEQLFLGASWADLVEIYRTRAGAPSLAGEPRARATVLFRLAQVLEERCGDLDQAVQTYWEVARLDPTHAPALRQLRGIHTRREQWDLVLQLAEIEAQLPLQAFERAELLAELGGVWLDRLQDPGQALGCFDQALEAAPDHAEAGRGRARTLEALGRHGDASSQLQQLVQRLRGPERASVWVALGRLHAGPLGSPDVAIEAYRRALTDDPRCPEAVEALSVLAGAQGQWELLADLFERRFDLASGARRRAAIALEAGQLHLERLDDPRLARMWLERAVELAEEDVAVHHALAELARRSGDGDALLRALERVIELSGDATPVSILLETSDLLGERGRDDRALEVLRTAMARAPENALVLEALSDLLSRLGRAGELVEVLERRAALAVDEPEALLATLCELGETFESPLDDAESAIAAYERARSIDPAERRVYAPLERLYRKAEAWSPLRELYADLCRCLSGAEAAPYHGRLGELLLETFQESRAAAEAFEAALRIDPEDARALAGLGRIADESGDEDARVRAWSREAAVCADRERLSVLVRQLVEVLEGRGEAGRAEALGWVERQIAADPENPSARKDQARLLEALGRHDALRETLERLDPMLAGPDQVANRLRLAELAEDDDVRLAWTERALEVQPDHVEALTGAVALYDRAGRLEERARAQRRLADQLPPEAQRSCLLELADLLEGPLGDTAGAIVVLWRLRQADADDLGILERLEGLLERAGRLEELVQLLDERRRILPEDAPEALELDLRQARLLLDSLGQTEEAIERLRVLRGRCPERPEVADLLERALRSGADPLALAAFLAERARGDSDPARRAARQLESGVILEESGGDLAHVRELFESLADSAAAAPIRIEARRRLEALLERQGDWSSLRRRLESRVHETPLPERPELHDRLATLCRDRLGDTEGCILHLEALGELVPERAGVWSTLADLYRQAGRREDRARALEREIETGPDPERERGLRGEAAALALEREDGAAALAHYERLHELDPGHAEAAEFLIRHHEAAGRPAEVVRLLDSRLASTPEPGSEASGLRLRIAGLRVDALDDLPGAIAVLEGGLSSDEQQDPLAPTLVDLYGRAGRSEDQRTLVRRLARHSSGDERAGWLMRLGGLLRQRSGEPEASDEAVVLYREVLALRPGDPDARAALRSLHRQRGEATELAASLRQELEAGSSEDPLLLSLELAELEAGPLDQPEAGLSTYQRILAIAPDHAEAFERAVSLAERLDRAEDLLTLVDERLAGRLDPAERATLLARKGRLLAGPLDRLEEAPPVLREALALDDACDGARAALREALVRLGRWPAVLDCLYLEAARQDGPEKEQRIREAADLARDHLGSDASLPWLERLRALRPGDPDVVGRIAEVHRCAGRPEALLRALEDHLALEDDPALRLPVQVERAEILERELGSPGRALRVLEAARAEEARPDARLLGELDRLYALTGRTRERAEVLEERLERFGAGLEPGARLALHRELAELWAGLLSEPRRAVAHRLHAVAMAPAQGAERVERLEELAACLRGTADPAAWARASEALLEALDEEARSQPAAALRRRVELRMELAETCASSLADPSRAREHREALLDSDTAATLSEAERETIELALLDGLRTSGDAVALEERLSQRLARRSAERRASDWLELARVRDEQLHSPARACEAYLRAVAADPRDLESLHGLRQAAERLGRWDAVVACLEREAGVVAGEAGPERGILLRRAGELAWHRLDDVEAADRLLAQALDASPRDLGAFRLRQQLASRRADAPTWIALARQELEVLDPAEASRRQALWIGIAERSHEPGEARSAYAEADRADPLPAEVLRTWAERVRESGDGGGYAELLGRWCEAPGSDAGARDHLELAAVLADLGREEEALAHSEQASELEPGLAAAWERVGSLRAALGRPEQAALALDRAAALADPRAAAELLRQAADLVRESYPRKAAERLRGAAERDPADVHARAALAGVAARLESWDEAEQAAASALDLDAAEATLAPERRRSLCLLAGRAARERGRDEAAARHFSLALESGPDPEAVDGLAEALFRLGDVAGAGRLLADRVDGDSPGDARAHQLVIVALALEQEGDPEQAFTRYQQALDLDPDDGDAHAGVCRLLECSGRHDEAIAALETWAARCGDAGQRSRLRHRAAGIALDAGMPDAAESLLRASGEADPSEPAPWLSLAELLEATGQARECERITSQALEQVTEPAARARLRVHRARARAHDGRIQEGIEDYGAALREDPRVVEAACERAELLRREGDWARAARTLDRCAETHPRPDHPDLAAVHLARGRLLAGPLEDVEGALHAYERAVTLRPALVDAIEPMARLLTHVPGRARDAADLHVRLLSLDPTRREAVRSLSELAEAAADETGAKTGWALLRALGAASAEEVERAPTGLPLRLADTPQLADPLHETLRRLVQETGREIADALGWGSASEPAVKGRSEEERLYRTALEEELDQLGAPGLRALDDDSLGRLLEALSRAVLAPRSNPAQDPWSASLERSLGRWTRRRRLKRLLEDVELEDVLTLDVARWRRDLRGLAAAAALDRCGGDLRTALVALALPDEEPLPPESADLGSLVRRSPGARDLLARVTGLWCASLRIPS